MNDRVRRWLAGLGLSFALATSVAGEEAPTVRLVDIQVGSLGSVPWDLVWLDDTRVFLAAITRDHGTEPWVSDGTEAGTFPIDLIPGPLSGINTQWLLQNLGLAAGSGGRVFFAAQDTPGGDYELWITEGTHGSTHRVLDISPGPDGGYPYAMTDIQGQLYFAARDGGYDFEPWTSDGTESGTYLVADVRPGPGGSDTVWFRGVGDAVYFRANDGSHGTELWITRGTDASTHLIKDIYPGPADSGPSPPIDVNGTAYFSAVDDSGERGLWRSDGTEASTFRLGSGGRPVAVDGVVYFTGIDEEHGAELWRTDGTRAGTYLVRDIRPGPEGSSPQPWGGVDGRLLFGADDGVHGSEPWSTDGTPEGTRMVLDIDPGPSGAYGNLLVLRDAVVFRALRADTGIEPWITDGTAEGTLLIHDVVPGPESSWPRDFTERAGRLFFTAFDRHGHELWFARTAVAMGNPDRAIRDLRNDVLRLGLPEGLEKPLLVKLNAAGKQLNPGPLQAFIHQVDALSRTGKVAQPTATELLEFARQIVSMLDERYGRDRSRRSRGP